MLTKLSAQQVLLGTALSKELANEIPPMVLDPAKETFEKMSAISAVQTKNMNMYSISG